jgi:hypothetical protein
MESEICSEEFSYEFPALTFAGTLRIGARDSKRRSSAVGILISLEIAVNSGTLALREPGNGSDKSSLR